MSRKSTALTPPKPTTLRFTWRHVQCSVKHTRDYLSTGQSHIELTVLEPKGCPLPITDTGYLSHFIPFELLKTNGGPVAFFTTWLDQEATNKSYKAADVRWRQGNLFDDLPTHLPKRSEER